MSVAKVDRLTYHAVLTNAYHRYVKRGYPDAIAKQRAHELTSSAFVIDNSDRDDEVDQKESGIYG